MSASFDENLVCLPTPWATCVALEQYFAQGGQCKVSDETNWIYVYQRCATNATSLPGDQKRDVIVALTWSYLSILVRESLATNYSKEEGAGLIVGGMWDRAMMIARCGHHPGDAICDRDKVVEWCMNLPSVQFALQLETIPPIGKVDSDVRIAAEILDCLVVHSGLEATGDVARLLSFIAQATIVSAEKRS